MKDSSVNLQQPKNKITDAKHRLGKNGVEIKEGPGEHVIRGLLGLHKLNPFTQAYFFDNFGNQYCLTDFSGISVEEGNGLCKFSALCCSLHELVSEDVVVVPIRVSVSYNPKLWNSSRSLGYIKPTLVEEGL
jgi:hypothetical protein